MFLVSRTKAVIFILDALRFFLALWVTMGHFGVFPLFAAKLMGVPAEDPQQLGVWVNDITEVHGNFQHHPDRELRSYGVFKR